MVSQPRHKPTTRELPVRRELGQPRARASSPARPGGLKELSTAAWEKVYATIRALKGPRPT
jgi:hypothetical protein